MVFTRGAMRYLTHPFPMAYPIPSTIKVSRDDSSFMDNQSAYSNHFSLLPADTEDTASSRIRVYTLSRSLKALGLSVSLEYSMEADVLLVQIRLTDLRLDKVRDAKARGCTVIYDVDDLDSALWYFTPQSLFYQMLELADVVTTDTEPRRQSLIADYGASRVEVMPDAIDYYPSGPVKLLQAEGRPLRVLWFGGLMSMEHFERYIGVLSDMRDVQVVAIVSAGGIRTFREYYPEVEFIPWSRHTFVAALQTCHVSCLVHGSSKADLTKSNNKLITSINWGLPAVISHTPEYARTAREAGVAHAIFDDADGLVRSVEALRSPEARSVYLEKAQPYVWQHYAPAVVAERFLDIVARTNHSHDSTVQTLRVRGSNRGSRRNSALGLDRLGGEDRGVRRTLRRVRGRALRRRRQFSHRRAASGDGRFRRRPRRRSSNSVPDLCLHQRGDPLPARDARVRRR